MKLFDKFFGRKKKKEQELDEAFARVSKEISNIDAWDDPKKLEHYILDSCEQIIATTKDIKAEKKEYDVVTKYLDDIQIIDNLPDERANEVRSAAANILETDHARVAYLESAQRITDEQFVMMEQEADDMPSIISRMQENEKYQAKIKREMNELEGNKSYLEMQINETQHSRKRFLILSILVAVAFASFLILSLIIEKYVKMDVGMFRIILFAVTAIAAGVLFVFMSNMARDRRNYMKKLNSTISLLNVVRMKYVNVTKAVDYVCDKYNVESSYKLLYVWEQYLEAVKEKERFEKNNDDLEYFIGRLVRLLKRENLYDVKIWLTQTNALVHKDERVEIRHKLVKRRAKIRERMQENTKAVKSERDEIDKLMLEHHYYVPEILEIIDSVDKICGLNKYKS
ncbi:MAG: hypothetical protein K5644_04355 [Lachnospiraceae bacterium]|nr:hypothetical protein [Lachnospiraceae bacterium]